MNKKDVVVYLIEQVAMHFKIRYVCLDSGFYSLDVLEFLSQFKFIIGANGRKVSGDYDGPYVTRSCRSGKKLVFRIVSQEDKDEGREGGRRRVFPKLTNIFDLSRDEIFEIYDNVRTPIEVVFRDVKYFLLFTSSTKWVFRFFAFSLAILIYTLFVLFGFERSFSRFLFLSFLPRGFRLYPERLIDVFVYKE